MHVKHEKQKYEARKKPCKGQTLMELVLRYRRTVINSDDLYDNQVHVTWLKQQQKYCRRRQTPTDASEQNNTDPLGRPVTKQARHCHVVCLVNAYAK